MFEKGNTIWQLANTGRKRMFKTEDELWAACEEYFKWSDNNPLQEERVGFYKGSAIKVTVNKLRAYTQSALQLSLGISRETWQSWGRVGHDLHDTVQRANQVIYDQKLVGAAADQLNANIIARQLGLKDGHDLTSSDGSMTPDRITRTIIKPE